MPFSDEIAICEDLMASLDAADTQIRVAAAEMLPYSKNARIYRAATARCRELLRSLGVDARSILTFPEVLGGRDEDTEELLSAAVAQSEHPGVPTSVPPMPANRPIPQLAETASRSHLDDGPEGAAELGVPFTTDERTPAPEPVEELVHIDPDPFEEPALVEEEPAPEEDEIVPSGDAGLDAELAALRAAIGDVGPSMVSFGSDSTHAGVQFGDPEDVQTLTFNDTGSGGDPFAGLVSFEEPEPEPAAPEPFAGHVSYDDGADPDAEAAEPSEDGPVDEAPIGSGLVSFGGDEEDEASEDPEEATGQIHKPFDAEPAAPSLVSFDEPLVQSRDGEEDSDLPDEGEDGDEAAIITTNVGLQEAIAEAKAQARPKSRPPAMQDTFDLMPDADISDAGSDTGVVTPMTVARTKTPATIARKGTQPGPSRDEDDVKNFEDADDSPSAREVIVKSTPPRDAFDDDPATNPRASAGRGATSSPTDPGRASDATGAKAPAATAAAAIGVPRPAPVPALAAPKAASTPVIGGPKAAASPTIGAPKAAPTPAIGGPKAAAAPSLAGKPAAAAIGGAKAAVPTVAARKPIGGPLPMVRDGTEPKPRSAAIQLGAGPGQQSKVLGFEEEEEPLEMGEAEGDVEVGDGFSLQVEEYEDEIEEEEEEEELAAPAPPPPPIVEPKGPDMEEIKALIAKAEESKQANDMDHAVALYSDVLDHDPDNIDGHIGRGRLYLDLADYARAMSDFTVAEDLAPQSPEPQVAIGDLYFARKDYRKAIDYFNEALKISPNHAMAFCRRGISHYYRKDYDEAVGDLNKALKLAPDIPNIQTFLSMARKRATQGRK